MAKALNSAQECRPHVNHWPEGTQLLFQSTIFSFPTGWYLYWPPISRPYTFTNWTRHLGAFDLLWTLWLSLLSSWPITPTQALRHWDKRCSSTLNVLIAIRQTFCQVKDTSCSHIFWINTEICFFPAQSIGYLYSHNLKQRLILYISKLFKLSKKGDRIFFYFCCCCCQLSSLFQTHTRHSLHCFCRSPEAHEKYKQSVLTSNTSST